MKLAVRYKPHNKNIKPQTLIIDLDENVRNDEDAINDYCNDYITDMLGEEPKWISVKGSVTIGWINYDN